jgi:SRSO17 transposase
MVAAPLAEIHVPCTALAPERLRRLDDYVECFRSVFARADQYRWFAAYVRGVLECAGRRNVESIARAVTGDAASLTAVAQALHNFVGRSPWNDQRLWGCYRALVRDRKTPREWIIHDGVFPKTGRCSVGAQRQFARALGRKINCQVAVVVSALNSAEYIPLATRLYLPSYWLRNQEDVAATTVPEAHRQSIGKAEIAAQLLVELLDEEPLPTRVLAEDSYAGAGGLAELLAARGVALVPASAASGDHVGQSLAHFERLKEDLGLDHFEGRSWQGWHHHVSIVTAAYGFLLWEQRAR